MERAENNHLEIIISKLAEKDIDFIICGGVACVLHGVERMTLDLDLSLNMTPSNINKFIQVLESINMRPRVPLPAETLLDQDKIKRIIEEKNALVFTFIDIDKPYKQIDVFLTTDHSYDNLRNHTINIIINGHEVKVLSKDKLIRLKQNINPMRDKDKLDIQELSK